MSDLLALRARGDSFILFDEAGNTEIGMAREVIVKNFLESGCDDLVFIDDDVCWQEGALLRLLDHNVDCVGGAYPKRKDPIEWPVDWLDGDELYSVNGLLEVKSLPTGFLRLSRECLATMYDNYGWSMFDNIREETRIYEDISFCQRWRDIDGQVWLDPEITMGHVGNKVFAGNIGDFIKNDT